MWEVSDSVNFLEESRVRSLVIIIYQVIKPIKQQQLLFSLVVNTLFLWKHGFEASPYRVWHAVPALFMRLQS